MDFMKEISRFCFDTIEVVVLYPIYFGTRTVVT